MMLPIGAPRRRGHFPMWLVWFLCALTGAFLVGRTTTCRQMVATLLAVLTVLAVLALAGGLDP